MKSEHQHYMDKMNDLKAERSKLVSQLDYIQMEIAIGEADGIGDIAQEFVESYKEIMQKLRAIDKEYRKAYSV